MEAKDAPQGVTIAGEFTAMTAWPILLLLIDAGRSLENRAMAEAVLDASAVLALLRQEPGSEPVGPIIAGSLMSIINASEVLAKLIERGTLPADAEQVVASLPFAWVDSCARGSDRASCGYG